MHGPWEGVGGRGRCHWAKLEKCQGSWPLTVTCMMLDIILPAACSRPGAGYQCLASCVLKPVVLYLMYFKSPTTLSLPNCQWQSFWSSALESSSKLSHVFFSCPTFSGQSWIILMPLGQKCTPCVPAAKETWVFPAELLSLLTLIIINRIFHSMAIKVLKLFHSLSHLILVRILKTRTNVSSMPPNYCLD